MPLLSAVGLVMVTHELSLATAQGPLDTMLMDALATAPLPTLFDAGEKVTTLARFRTTPMVATVDPPEERVTVPL